MLNIKATNKHKVSCYAFKLLVAINLVYASKNHFAKHLLSTCKKYVSLKKEIIWKTNLRLLFT